MRRAVLFDLDDTLFDHQYCRRVALRRLTEAYPSAGRVEFARLEEIHDIHLQTTHSLLLERVLTLTQARQERMRLLFGDLGVELAEDELNEADRVYRGGYESARRPVPGAIDLLRRVRERCRVCVVTNGVSATQRMKIDSCNMESLIDHLVISDEVGAKKPESRIFEIALERAQCGREEAIMIGDSWHLDVLGAHRAGIAAVWVNRVGAPNPEPGSVIEVPGLEPAGALFEVLTR